MEITYNFTPLPCINKIKRNYLVIDGYLTRNGWDYLKMMSVYHKSLKH